MEIEIVTESKYGRPVEEWAKVVIPESSGISQSFDHQAHVDRLEIPVALLQEITQATVDKGLMNYYYGLRNAQTKDGMERTSIIVDVYNEDLEYLKTCKRAYTWETFRHLAEWAIHVWVSRRKADDRKAAKPANEFFGCNMDKTYVAIPTDAPDALKHILVEAFIESKPAELRKEGFTFLTDLAGWKEVGHTRDEEISQ